MISFRLIGINYKVADYDLRSQFALNKNDQEALLKELKGKNIGPLMILSTCNRTEIYFFGSSSDIVSQTWLDFLKINSHDTSLFYEMSSVEAMRHLLCVTAGAESQIPGDYEIVAQVKQAFLQSYDLKMSDGYLEKLVNTAIRVSRRVKTETKFSTGTSSVSYAVAKSLKGKFSSEKGEKVLVVGLGKIGSLCTRYLSSSIPQSQIFVTNRSAYKAEELAQELNVQSIPFAQVKESLDFDYIILATQADHDILTVSNFQTKSSYTVYDLTMPSNVEEAVKSVSQVQLIDVDVVSAVVNQSLEERVKDLPAVQAIVEEELTEMGKWWYIKQFLLSSESQFNVQLKEKIRAIRALNISSTAIFSQQKISF